MEQNFNEQDSLRIINSMISTARGNIQKGAGKYFILWGYLVFLASLSLFLLDKFAEPRVGGYSIIWLGVMVIGIIASFTMGYKDSKKTKVITYTDSIVRRIWLGFIIGLIAIMVLLSGKMGWYIYPAITFTYTFALYITAVAYKFKWMFVSVLVCFICVILYKYIGFDYYPLLMALAIVVGNIAPGHYLNYKAKQQDNV